MSERQPITYADAQQDLPRSDFAKRLAELRISRTFAAKSTANDNSQDTDKKRTAHEAPDQHAPFVDEEDRPFPAPRPSFDFVSEVDAAAFEERRERVRQRFAAQHAHPEGERPMSDDQSTRRPIETLREGQLKAAIWQNESDNGKYHSVTVARTYKDQDGNLQDTSSFRAKDMLGLSELARRAHHHAHDLDREAFKEQRREQQEQGQERSQSHSR
ncbi:MAG: hypothetical protein AAF317_17165 [Pseudomonadota bacterium]